MATVNQSELKVCPTSVKHLGKHKKRVLRFAFLSPKPNLNRSDRLGSMKENENLQEDSGSLSLSLSRSLIYLSIYHS